MKKLCFLALAMAFCLGNAGILAAGDWVSSGVDNYYTGGNIGIGTTTPGFPLQIVSDNDVVQVLRVEGNSLTTGSSAFIRNYSYASTGKAMYLQNLSSGTALYVEQANSGKAVEILHYPNSTSGTPGDATGLYIDVDNTIGKSYAAIINRGNVGIGDLNPEQKLTVYDKFLVRGNNPAITISDDSAPDVRWVLRNQNSYFTLYRSNADGSVTNYNNPDIAVLPSGSVGIGTLNPQSTLAVNGTITAKEVVVTTDGWADYVFDDDYKLMPLAEVEKHIKTEKHLPDIPSAKEVKENGVSLGDMQTKMMTKIEELTLHMIAQNKKLERLENENLKLKKEIEALQPRN